MTCMGRTTLSVWLLRSLATWVSCPIVNVNAQSLPLVTVRGSKFFDESGKQFYIKGISYGPVGSFEEGYNATRLDALADPTQCALDAALMQSLGVNTVSVYDVDSTLDHTECMKILESRGIYVILGLSTPDNKIHLSQPSWTQGLFDVFTQTLFEFSQYDNLLAVVLESESVGNVTQNSAAPYLKAALTDIKRYRDAQGMRAIPVGHRAGTGAFSAPDFTDNNTALLKDYLGCGGNNSVSVDFIAYDQYSACATPFAKSGYESLYNNSLSSHLPQFFSTITCADREKRTFEDPSDQNMVLGPDMNQEWSGSVVFRWLEAGDGTGIVSYDNGGTSANFGASGSPTPILPAFTNLKSRWATLTPSGVNSFTYTPSETTPACPSSTANGSWTIDGEASLPTIKNLVYQIRSRPGKSSATSTQSLRPTTSSRSSSSPALSTGEGAAIGVVVPLAVIVCFVITAWVLHRKRKAKALIDSRNTPVSPAQDDDQDSRKELGGREISQLHSENARKEADGRTRYQLSDDAAMKPELADAELQELSTGPSVKRRPNQRTKP